MTKIIEKFLKETKQTELLLGYTDGVCRLTKQNKFIIIDYKDNDMEDFCYGAEINANDLKMKVVIKMIKAFMD